MQIVTDSGTDVWMSKEDARDLNIHTVPLVVTLDEQSYREGIDIQPEAFYELLAETDSLPVTSQPSAGDFAELYRKLAATDPDILSIHMSSGLSGTFNSAKTGASLVPEANVTHVDTKTLSAAAGWQVEMAAKAVRAGWPLDKTLALMKKVSDASESLYTISELKYLIHGGRISHMKGLIANVLKLKPMIGVEKVNGTYTQRGQVRTFKRALSGLVKLMQAHHTPGTALRVQVLHANNPEPAAILREEIGKIFDCTWLPTATLSLVLGAHTGPSMIAAAFAPQEIFTELV